MIQRNFLYNRRIHFTSEMLRFVIIRNQ